MMINLSGGTNDPFVLLRNHNAQFLLHLSAVSAYVDQGMIEKISCVAQLLVLSFQKL